MPCFFVVIKLLMLKLLLASISSGLHDYEFGYHPSAEEFDQFLRESTRTWTRELLANERRRAFTESKVRNEDGFFVPKYHYESEPTRYPPMVSGSHDSWPGYVQKVPKPQQSLPQRYDQQSVAATNHLINHNNIASSLDLTVFSHEQQDMPVMPGYFTVTQTPNKEKPRPLQAPSLKPFTVLPQVLNVPPVKQTLSTVIELEPATNEGEKESGSLVESQIMEQQLHKNRTQAHFPIFFTNPVTGIVYAITEVGKVQNSSMHHSNDTIPIYITKEQYDRDLFLLRKYYEKRCHPSKDSSSVVSMPSNTTTRPQIIRLQKPQNSVSKLPIAKLPSPLRKPPPVMVQTEVTISDQISELPGHRKKKSKLKRKKNKSKRPGHRQTTAGVSHNAPGQTAPQIVLGTRSPAVKTATTTEKQLSTQLEKPRLTKGTIFSKYPLVKTGGVLTPLGKLPLKTPNTRTKRSVTNVRLDMEQAKNEANATEKHHNWTPNLEETPRKIVAIKSSEMRSTKVHTRRRGPTRVGNHTVSHKRGTFTRNVTHTKRHHKVSTTPRTKLEVASEKALNSTQKGYHDSITSTLHRNVTNETPTRVKKKKDKSKRRKQDKRDKDDDGFDILDLMDDEDDDDDDDDSDSDSSDYEYEGPPRRNKLPTSTSTESSETHENYSDENFDDLREEIPPDNGSYAEESADYGAMEASPEIHIEAVSSQLETPLSSSTKGVYSKTRIRRRPPIYSTASDEDYDDDDDSGGGGGVGGFFRMIFYPVQVFMSSVFDGFSDKSDDDYEPPPYPTYTEYHSAVQPEFESDDAEDEEQSNSLSSWFSSWFGFNRRTKNIGNTTPYPVAPPTEAPSWFSSWFGTGSNEDEDYDDGKWFFGWFDSKPKRSRRTTTTTTTVRTPAAQVPILTIVDPLKNPQNWIGILAHHIINSTSTTTHNPLINAITRGTLTATHNENIPRRISYDKYQIWRLKPLNEGHVIALREYKKSEEGGKLQWLKGPTLRGLTDVLVPPRMQLDFEGTLSFESIAHEVLIYDVGKAIAYEKAQELHYFNTTPRPRKQHNKQQRYPPPPSMSWHKYYAYEDIITYLEQLRMRHPQLVELIHIGRSYEGRPLVVVKLESRDVATSSMQAENVKHTKLKHKKRPTEANAVFIEAGSHGMEWIGPATTLWMISEVLRLIKSNKTSAEHEFIRNTTWYVMPILNPDGYVYSHKYDRFWRKSRSRHISKPGGIVSSAMTWLQQKQVPQRICYGVDLDRNWQYQWGKRGSSKSPCNEFYAGPAPFSEPETKALSEFLMDYRKQIKLYLSLQAYGQIISYPIKANASYNAERIDDFFDVAMVGTDGLRKKGSKSRYKIDSTSELIERRSGCSDAFAAYEVGIPFSYTIQLADNGVHGYLLPSASIEPAAREAFEIITAMIDYI